MGIRHNGSQMLATVRESQTSMILELKRASIGGNVLRPYKRARRFLYNTRRSGFIMSSPPRNRLWNPASGIRFSPRAGQQAHYPVLEVSRFIHTPNSSADAAQTLKLDNDEFSDDEEFERNAAEWFDEQDLLMLPPPVSDAEEPQILSDADGEPLDGAEPKGEPVKPIPPPVTSLDYNIDPALYRAAQNSKEGTDESYWTYRMYHRILDDGSPQKVKVHYCTSKHTMEHVCKKYFASEKVIGFDLEWMIWAKREEGPRKNVSLIQIASPSRIALFHVALFLKNDFLAPTFKRIMEDESVRKVGVAIKGDCTRLNTQLGVDAKGIFELSHLYRLVKYSKSGELDLINRTLVSLAAQTQEFLGLPLYKGQSVRSSNWMLPLSERQIAYSASDAYAGMQLYHVMDEERQKLDPSPPRPEFAEKGLPIRFLTAEDVDESDALTDSGIAADAGVDVGIEEAAMDLPGPTTATKKQTREEKASLIDPRITEAELELHRYRARIHRTLKVGPSTLRAYYVWHANEDLPPESVARLLRDPPLKTNTVVSYILDAIAFENMPFSKPRLRDEVLALLAPEALLRPKYQALVEDAQGAEEA